MPNDAIESEREQMAADAGFITEAEGASTASVSTAESTRSARAVVLFRLIEGPVSPEAIGSDTPISAGRAHRALTELHKRDLVELLVPEEASDGPIFGVTARGEKAAFHIEQQKA
ncbi:MULTISPECIES: hypothetical protein [Halococcus]|uniref:Transcriptional regulator, MarR family protein n=1 Tax=Halococcus salifodinae DSM 8989 TaxID=1227456 RepID=M0MWH8_9EURY|nr:MULTISPECIES: hypothetical protein [Halococcus]EMA49184.1 transcriptional regulator, MarR family protein [Halococcus salifodinae DSM 8989]